MIKLGPTSLGNSVEVLKKEILEVDRQLLDIEASSGDISGG